MPSSAAVGHGAPPWVLAQFVNSTSSARRSARAWTSRGSGDGGVTAGGAGDGAAGDADEDCGDAAGSATLALFPAAGVAADDSGRPCQTMNVATAPTSAIAAAIRPYARLRDRRGTSLDVGVT